MQHFNVQVEGSSKLWSTSSGEESQGNTPCGALSQRYPKAKKPIHLVMPNPYTDTQLEPSHTRECVQVCGELQGRGQIDLKVWRSLATNKNG